VKQNFGALPEEIVQTVSRSFGFRSTSAQLREAILAQVRALTSLGQLAVKGDLVIAGGETPVG
jgi:hypothetical protein